MKMISPKIWKYEGVLNNYDSGTYKFMVVGDNPIIEGEEDKYGSWNSIGNPIQKSQSYIETLTIDEKIVDQIIGKNENGEEILKGTTVENIIHGTNGDDIINGKKGNDTLIGNFGNDIYIFSKRRWCRYY